MKKINTRMQKKILLQILPGFIPLLVFIVADEIWGTQIGLMVAIGTGMAELLIYWIKDRKFDKFILFDTLLIVTLGVISMILDNDVFFKLKPALMGVLVCAILAISAFTPSNILLNMSKRYMKGIEFNNEQYIQLRKQMKALFYIFSVYTVLVFYSVWNMSKEGWAFVSGGLFYILFGLYFTYTFLKSWQAKRKLKNEEWLPLLNKEGEIIGKAPRSACHADKKLLHPVVHLHVVNDNNDIFLQKRPLIKSIQPGKWDTAVGGHVSFGESIEISLQREAEEEIGIKNYKPHLVDRYIWESEVESEYVFCFVTRYNGEFNLHKTELDGGRFWSIKEIEKSISKGVFTPNFEKEFLALKDKFSSVPAN